ncbi:DNA polymerase IV [Cetobacterium sp. 2A]|uniref:DNA polymerase IV n=1 Tax=Cetobacterium sp. 2A TaxID=2754723 RepID=UPI00163D045B|nr:DNA polymerase IV [Cetobacterium sp. 2A]MBC2856681.1 DNA polymerase IV [Cetobacterium sp. 2A]
MEKNKRVILHYDMDCFYASIEVRDNQRLKGKPMVVAGGIITTASYEARKYGIKSAMPVLEAKKLCHGLIIVPVNKDKYLDESEKIQKLVLKITNKVEFIALDEGYVDITEIIKNYPSKEYFAKKFREGIKRNTGLTCSVGIGYNKLSAKIASDINKPGGQYIFKNSEEFVEYIKEKPIKILPGVGKKLQEILERKGITYVKSIFPYSYSELSKEYGNSRGEVLYSYSRGIDYRNVEYEKQTHSIGHENTYRIPLTSEVDVEREIDLLFSRTYERLLENKLLCKTIVLKIRFNDMETITRSKTMNILTDSKVELRGLLDELEGIIELKKPIRLLGVSVGNLSDKNICQMKIDFYQ